MSAPKKIDKNKIVFKKGSYEWFIHFGFSIGLFSIGAVGTVSFISQLVSASHIDDRYIELHLPAIILGILTYYLQARKLNLKLLNSFADINSFREIIRNSVLEAGWKVEYDNKHVFIASIDGWFGDEQVIIKFKTSSSLWTAINHPGNHNSLASQFGTMTKANKLIAEIKKHSA